VSRRRASPLDHTPRLSTIFGRAKIRRSDPPLPTVWAAYPTPRFLPFFHPPLLLNWHRAVWRLRAVGWRSLLR
jgi:hypothetical protein